MASSIPTAAAATTTTSLSSADESRYRKEVLHLEGEENTEESLEEQLVAEAAQLGLKIPDIQIAASLAATINAGYIDISVSSAGSTHTRPSLTHPHSVADLVRSSALSIDLLAGGSGNGTGGGGSVSETTPSDRGNSGSIPSIDSFSTRPTSISSCDVRAVPPPSSAQQLPSPSSPASSSVIRLPERKRSSFIHAIGRPFWKRRTPSAVNLPPNAHISLKKNEAAGAGAERGEGASKPTSTVLVETKPIRIAEAEASEKEAQEQETVLKVEVPVFDEAALQRSMEDARLRSLFESHKAQRSRFLRLQNELLDCLKAAHLIDVANRKSANEVAEQAKQEQVRISS